MKKKKMPNPDTPLTDSEWESMGKVMHGIDALPKDAQVAIRKMMGRPRSEKPKKVISFRFDTDIISHLKDCVAGYNTRVENILREAIKQGKL
ncbi:MAG: BrnA antitoxin family protein [Rickettsiales bacterium]